MRKLLEHLGKPSPVVVLFDDIQWAEPTFLDLLEYLVDWIQSAPVLLICLARPELLEQRPGWMTGKANATRIALEPLSGPETAMLIRNLIGHTLPVENALSRVVDVSEEIHSSSRRRCACSSTTGSSDDSRAKWEVSGALSTIAIPPTIHALLATRLDRLGDEERAVIERASVVGRQPGWGAVAELSPPEIRSELSAHLRSLLDKELIRPDTEVGQEDAFRFAHQLIRDAAYRAIPKAVRADLHERLADWFEARASERPGEYDEILGHHTEQAYQSLLELVP